jgi:CheY-like chemotaxis protein
VIPSVRPLRVLVADDNLVNRKLASIVLQRAGHHVTTANDGRTAVTLAAREAFDVILMDVQMPELNGCEATQVIRAKERENGDHVTIIALTAQAMKGHADECLESGMDGYVSKPLHAPTLFDTIERLTSNSRRLSQGRSHPVVPRVDEPCS